MRRVGFTLKVKKELIDEYTRRHQDVWPEMLDALRRNGWHNYSIFLRDDGLLFGYFEAADSFEASLDGMSLEDVNRTWQAEMAPFFDGPGGQADHKMEELFEVFHLD